MAGNGGPPCIELWWWRRCNGGGLVGLWIEVTHGNGEEPGGEGEPANAKSEAAFAINSQPPWLHGVLLCI